MSLYQLSLTLSLAVCAASCALGETITPSKGFARMIQNDQLGAHPASEQALTMLGTRYKWGGTSKSQGMDCSGFVFRSYQDATGIALPRTAKAMAQQLAKVMPHELRAGDLVFFNTRGSPFSHVGIYLGGSLFAHAPRTGQLARIDNLEQPYWIASFDGARRPALTSVPNSEAWRMAIAPLMAADAPTLPKPNPLPALPESHRIASLTIKSTSTASNQLPDLAKTPLPGLALPDVPNAIPDSGPRKKAELSTVTVAMNTKPSEFKGSFATRAEPALDISGMAVALPSPRRSSK
jgi:hypothetical protein